MSGLKRNIKGFLQNSAQDSINLAEDANTSVPTTTIDLIHAPSSSIEHGSESSYILVDTSLSGSRPSLETQPSRDEIQALHQYLTADTPEPTTTEDVAKWLVNTLDEHPSKSLSEWCNHWTGRMDSAKHYQDQMTIQSLFMQSLRTLQSLSAPEASLPYVERFAVSHKGETMEGIVLLGDIYVAVDIFDGKSLPPLSDSQAQEFLAY